MSNMAELIQFESAGDFFAPVSSDLIDSLLGQYRATKQKIEHVAEMVVGETAGAVSYFLEGNGRDSRYSPPSVERLFQKAGAVAALNAAYWSKAIHLTDVLDAMPQKRRDEWNESITNMTCPEFEEETVRNTLLSLLNMRSQFLAERVDGIFRGLSGEHVTNSPAAFGKRMIVNYVLSESHGFYSENYSKCGLINDLRCVIAKFMGRDEPGYNASSGLIRTLKGRWGEWVTVDGGALKIRLYKKGTAHIEVHPDMAWRLNATLAHLYPMAIPPEFRQKPARKIKDIELIQRPLPFAVLDLLAGMKTARGCEKQENFLEPYRHFNIPNALQFGYGDKDKHATAEAVQVIESIGGVKKDGYFQFDYNPESVVDSIVSSGCIPDQKSHQFYPTPEALAKEAVELAEIEPEHVCLEPSAGTGGLADHMPSTTRCVEVSALHCEVLTAKGYNTTCADFLDWSAKTAERFDRIVLNPPFDRGQWQAHIEAAARLLKPHGRLVAILPEGAKNRTVLPDLNTTWSRTYDNAFPGTSVSVVILVGDNA